MKNMRLRLYILSFDVNKCYGPNLSKTRPFKIRTFLSGFQLAFGKMAAIWPDFRCHLKSRPFATQPLLNHSKYRLVWVSDPHWTFPKNCWVMFNFFVLQERSSDRERKSRERDRHDMGPPQSSSLHRRSAEPPAEDRGLLISSYFFLPRVLEFRCSSTENLR